MTLASNRLGDWGERFAAAHFERLGFEIVQRNMRTPAAEIDLIAENENLIVFCEVKSRTSVAFGHPSEAVDSKRLTRISAAIELWPNPAAKNIRVDVIAIALYPRLKLEHFEGVGI